MNRVVYKIKFPCGRFYIGSTNNLKERIKQHVLGDSYVSDIISDLDYDYKTVSLCTEVLHSGHDFREKEQEIIFSFKLNNNLLNKRVLDPSREIPDLSEYKNIRITEQTHDKLKAVKKVTGQTLDRIILDALKEKHKGMK